MLAESKMQKGQSNLPFCFLLLPFSLRNEGYYNTKRKTAKKDTQGFA
jgi:hypothetical protein